MTASPLVLLLAPRLKDYWASPYGQARVARVLTLDALRLPRWTYRLNILAFFALATYARMVAKRFDAVVCVDRHLALAFGMIKRLTGLKTPTIAHQFILPDADAADRMSFAATWDRVASRGLNRVVVNSSHEARAYAGRLAPHLKFNFIPLGVAPKVFELVTPLSSTPSVFSGGGAERDYPTLIRAVRDGAYSVEVITFSQRNLEGEMLPVNMRARYSLPFVDFLKVMASAWVVVLPLRRTERSAGQATLVYAQAMGKAVIASDIPGVRDYITHDVNGLLVPPADPVRLQHAISRVLSDTSLRTRLESKARSHALNTYAFATYDHQIGKALDNLVNAEVR